MRPRFAVRVAALRTRDEVRRNERGPAVPFDVAEISASETKPALKVRYGPEEDGDEVVLFGHDGRLFAPWDGADQWQHGPRWHERGVSPERLAESLAAEVGGLALRSLLAPERPQFRNRTGPIPLADPEAEVAARASKLLFVDGRLHRQVGEPTWEVIHQNVYGGGGGALVRPRIVMHSDGMREAKWEVRFDRPETAERLAMLRARRHRNCRVAAPCGAVEILDPAYEPSFDAEIEIARGYGDKLMRLIEPTLAFLDRGCVEAFAEMCDGLHALAAADPEAGRFFCDGLATFCERLAADKAAIPPDLKNFVRERVPGFVDRLTVAREMERGGFAPAPR